MFRVVELYFVEHENAWAAALGSNRPDQKLEKGMMLVAGMRRWEVTEVHEAPAGLHAGRLEGAHRLTKGLVLRPTSEALGEEEYVASCRLLVQLAYGMRAVDLPGLLAALAAARAADADKVGPHVRAAAKLAVLVQHVVEHGPTDAELNATARELGISEQVHF